MMHRNCTQSLRQQQQIVRTYEHSKLYNCMYIVKHDKSFTKNSIFPILNTSTIIYIHDLGL